MRARALAVALGRAGGVAIVAWAVCFATPTRALAQTIPPPAAQNPSPMVERTRAHGRLEPATLPGAHRSFAGPLDKPVELFVPSSTRRFDRLRLVVHFHGAAFVAQHAVSALGGDTAVATVHLGPGSGVYDRTFNDPETFSDLLEAVRREVSNLAGRQAAVGRVTLVGFSAGSGAVRAILRHPAHLARVDDVLLLDGLHTDYVPDRTVLADGGRLDDTRLAIFLEYARAAVRGEKRFLVTHSEIFPGTFASTTETADFLIEALGLRRTPVLRWGPGGMQQISVVEKGRLRIAGFAGNSAPDHVDHLHGMAAFLRMLLQV